MNKILLSLSISFLLCLGLSAQTVVLDFETDTTSRQFQYFGSTLENTLTNVIANPDQSGINTSAMVSDFTKPANSESWAGAWANPGPTTDLTTETEICLDVWFPSPGNLAIKLENGDKPNWILQVDVTDTMQWTQICYNAQLPSIEDPFEPAAGGVYGGLVLFFDFNTVLDEEKVYYLDNVITREPVVEQTGILDFETDSTSTVFNYFGSTLEGSTTSVIANPDPSGINTSPMVSDFMKPANSQSWAGAWGVLPKAIDLTSETDICVDVWFPNTGNLALKIEGGDKPNWVRMVDVTDTMQWTQICFNTELPSIEDPFESAAGGTYGTLVLFADFNTVLDEERTYYIDNVVTREGSTPTASITFAVDMNDYSENFTTVYVSGTFNNWSGDANPLSDADADGVWTGEISGIPAGAHEYKFQLDGWMAQEAFIGTESCTVKDTSGQFINRLLVVSGDETLPTVCYNSCYECGNSITITVNLGQGSVIPSEEGFFIAGGNNFGIPGDFPLTDPDGDGVHTIVFERQLGFESYYTFANGACGNFDCKENIGGQDCANPDNFNDRFMGPITSDTTFNTCFGLCTTTTDCGEGTMVSFSVDMSDYSESFTTVFLSGNFNGWSADANPLTDNGDGTWSGTVELAAGNYEYKFQLDGWATQEEFTEGDPCTVTNGGFTNRALSVGSEDLEVCYKFNTCDECETSGLNELEFDPNIFSLRPSVVQDETTITFLGENTSEKTISIFNATGQLIQSIQMDASTEQYLLSTSQFNAGLYLVNVRTESKQQTSRMIVTQQ